jgi:hypothetical protein
MAAWRPQNIGQITKIKTSSGCIAKGILTPSFIEIAPAVTKCALLTDECIGVKFGQIRPCTTTNTMVSAVWSTQQNITNLITPLILSGSSPHFYHRCIYWRYTTYHTIFRFDLLFKDKEVKLKFSHFWPPWPWKVGQMRHVHYKWCIPTKYTNSNNLVMLALIVTSEMALVRFWLMPPGGQIWSPIGPKFGIHIKAA